MPMSVRRQIDSRIEVVTPEQIAFQYRVAGPFTRLPAYLFDLAIRGALVAAVSFVLVAALSSVGLEGSGIGLSLLLWFVVAWFYGGLFETITNGQTPGKRIMMLRVVSIDGRPINALQAVLRNVLRSVDAMPVMFYTVGLVSCLCTRRYQRLGDIASGTMVIMEERRPFAGLTDIREPRALGLLQRVSVDYAVGSSMARALIQYVQRRENFSPGHRSEIAGHLGKPLARQLGLPAETDSDLLLCALYHRALLADQTSPVEAQ